MRFLPETSGLRILEREKKKRQKISDFFSNLNLSLRFFTELSLVWFHFLFLFKISPVYQVPFLSECICFSRISVLYRINLFSDISVFPTKFLLYNTDDPYLQNDSVWNGKRDFRIWNEPVRNLFQIILCYSSFF